MTCVSESITGFPGFPQLLSRMQLEVNRYDWLWARRQEPTTLSWQGWTCDVSESFNLLSGFPPTLVTKWRSQLFYMCVILESSSKKIINNVNLMIDKIGHEMCLKALTCFPGFPQLSRECSFKSFCMVDLEICLKTISFVKRIKDKVGHDICLKAFWAFRVSPNSVTNDAWS